MITVRERDLSTAQSSHFYNALNAGVPIAAKGYNRLIGSSKEFRIATS
jgi:hypothetical protein